MRCKACNVSLNDFEATRKSKNTGEYLDLCNTCFSLARPDDSPVYERFDLISEADSSETSENNSSIGGLTD